MTPSARQSHKTFTDSFVLIGVTAILIFSNFEFEFKFKYVIAKIQYHSNSVKTKIYIQFYFDWVTAIHNFSIFEYEFKFKYVIAKIRYRSNPIKTRLITFSFILIG
jgi:hypothetical protein